MLSSVWCVAMSAALGAGPYGGPIQYVGGPTPGYPAPTTVEQHNPAMGDVSDGYPVVDSGEQLYPYDSPEPWLHGYVQEIPAYGGYGAFRPYNYRHVLSQSQAAGGWGMPANLPYSQQFWHRYHHQATMKEQLSQIGAGEYAAELGRLHARQDFESHRSGQGGEVAFEPPQQLQGPLLGGQPASQPQSIQQTSHTDNEQYEAMKRRIAEQQAKLKSLEGALQQRRVPQQPQQIQQQHHHNVPQPPRQMQQQQQRTPQNQQYSEPPKTLRSALQRQFQR